MSKIPAKVKSRIVEGIKRFKPVIEQAKSRDVGEADTSTLVKDILADLFGYDKYSEITAEFQIKGTYCDLALRIDGKIGLLIEVKAIGAALKESFIKQAVDYAANQGIEWVVLTNALHWQIYKLNFSKPVTSELLCEITFTELDPKDDSDLDMLFLLCREAQGKSLLDAYHEQRQALSKYVIGALMLSDPVVSVVRRELKRLSPDVRIEYEEIKAVMAQEVVKRELLEGDKAIDASKRISKAAGRALRSSSSEVGEAGSEELASGSASNA